MLGKVNGDRATPESLWLLSDVEYGEPKFWREIARHNDVEDPRTLVLGDEMIVPPLEAFQQNGIDDGR